MKVRKWNKTSTRSRQCAFEKKVSGKQQSNINYLNHHRRQHRVCIDIIIDIYSIEFLTSASSSTPQRNLTMKTLTRWTSLVILVISTCHFQTSEACTCLDVHPQYHFCHSSFVALLNVTNFRQPTDQFQVRDIPYEVDVKQIFKATQEARKALEEKPVWLWTTSMGSLCGHLNLTPGEMWLVTGGVKNNKLVIWLCDFAQIWSKVTSFQREGFQQSYDDGCDCAESERGLSCSLGSSGEKDCHKRYSICKSSSAGCHWAPSKDYNKCIDEQQRIQM